MSVAIIDLKSGVVLESWTESDEAAGALTLVASMATDLVGPEHQPAGGGVAEIMITAPDRVTFATTCEGDSNRAVALICRPEVNLGALVRRARSLRRAEKGAT